MKKKAFTLIELIAVLVILAILALIVTPLVMSIIRKAKISADKRSIDAYGRSVELAIASHLLDTGNFPTDLKSLTIEYTGKEVSCNVIQMKENGGIYLSECTVGTKAVKDETTDDGWYHYGTRDLTNEEYVDMYGKKLEAALKLYYDTNNTYPESIDALVIKSVGKTVTCTSSINYDGTVYLTNCKVDGVSIADINQEDGYYHYGGKKYGIGDEITYNGMQFYVIKNSDSTSSTLTMLKSEPLVYEEVDILYDICVDRSNIYNSNGYGGIKFSRSGGEKNYSTSDIKCIVDNWADRKLNSEDLVVDSTGYSVRLLSHDELITDLGYVNSTKTSEAIPSSNGITPNWVYSSDYFYWTMSQFTDDSSKIWSVERNGVLYGHGDEWDNKKYEGVVRPIITIKKSSLN